MPKQNQEPPINWFPSASDRKSWADQFAQIQAQKLKEQQAAHAARMQEESNRIKLMQLEASRKAAAKNKKTKK